MRSSCDVVVIGSGPNGLAAAIVAAQRGLSVMVIEGRDEIGGGLKTAELTLPGYRHDVCASVMPMGRVSPFFRSLPLDQHGLEWIVPGVSAAHPLDGGDAILLHNELAATAAGLGRDGDAWRLTIGTVARDWPMLEDRILGPLSLPAHPFRFGRFGVQALAPAQLYANVMFSDPRARALFAGCAAHAVLPLSRPGSAGIGIALAAIGHHAGWPVASGGAGAVADALASCLRSSGGEIITGTPIESASQLPDARTLLFDTSPRAVARILGDRLPRGFRSQLERYPYGPGAFKVDWALSEPIPWAAEGCRLASTVHVGGTVEEIALAEAAPWEGRCADRPFVLVTQPSLFDSSRAPPGRHTAWGYCHVPNGSAVDMTARIEAQVERFAPGFRDVILARAIRSPAVMEAENPNLVGGDVGAGSNQVMNLFFRPTWRRYATPLPNVYLCSGATPPGGGIHGMGGFHAAVSALSRLSRH